MKVWELRQALAEFAEDRTVVLRVHPPVSGWPSALASVRHLDAEMMLHVEEEQLVVVGRPSWGRPALALVGEDFDPESLRPSIAEPETCVVIEAWVRDGDGR